MLAEKVAIFRLSTAFDVDKTTMIYDFSSNSSLILFRSYSKMNNAKSSTCS